VFFLTRGLSAEAPTDSKGYKGEVNRGNRKKGFALENNRVFLALYNLFLFSGPSVLRQGVGVSCSLPPSWVWVLCACPVPLSRAVTTPSSSCAAEEWRSVDAPGEEAEVGHRQEVCGRSRS